MSEYSNNRTKSWDEVSAFIVTVMRAMIRCRCEWLGMMCRWEPRRVMGNEVQKMVTRLKCDWRPSRRRFLMPYNICVGWRLTRACALEAGKGMCPGGWQGHGLFGASRALMVQVARAEKEAQAARAEMAALETAALETSLEPADQVYEQAQI